MSTPTTVKAQIQSLIDSANATTGKEDATLTDAVGSLVNGYGSGEGLDVSKFGIINEVTGTNIATCDYVNENQHNVEVKLSSDTVTDFSGVEVKVLQKNLFNKEWIKDKSTYDVQTGSYLRKYFYLEPNTKYRCVVKKPNHGTNTVYMIFLGDENFDTDGANGISTIFGDGALDKSFVFTTGASGKMIIKSNSTGFWQDYDTRVDDEQTEIMIYKDGMGCTDEYEPYTEKTYTANADGTVDGVTSISPTMNIICDTEGVNVSAKYYCCPTVEYDRFWDNYQQYGNRINYYSAFYNDAANNPCWNEKTFKPKYKIKPNVANNIFRQIAIADMTQYDIDFSNCTNASYAFGSEYIEHIGVVDLSNSTNNISLITGGIKVHTVDKLILSEKTGNLNNGFHRCQSLINLTIEGVLKYDVMLNYSEVLSNESAKNVILHLADYFGTDNQDKYSVKFHANVWSRLAEEGNASPNGNSWEDYIADLGWLT